MSTICIRNISANATFELILSMAIQFELLCLYRRSELYWRYYKWVCRYRILCFGSTNNCCVSRSSLTPTMAGEVRHAPNPLPPVRCSRASTPIFLHFCIPPPCLCFASTRSWSFVVFRGVLWLQSLSDTKHFHVLLSGVPCVYNLPSHIYEWNNIGMMSQSHSLFSRSLPFLSLQNSKFYQTRT